jgi:hypothetical protein
MKPVDKFGHPIYGRTWQVLVEFGDRLGKAGYTEHHAKPNLFVRKMEDSRYGVNGSYYADLRGTDIVPIWEDADPLFYAFFRPTPHSWLARRLWSEEIGRLMSGYGIPTRLSFYNTSEPGGLFFDEGDGYFARCGIDFGAEGLYCRSCSPIVEAEQRAARTIDCGACGVGIDPQNELYIRHHVSYFPPRAVVVHVSCHAAIHLQGKHSHLAPPKGDAERFYTHRRVG